MRDSACAERTHVDLARNRLGIGNEFRKVSRWKRRIRDQHENVINEPGYRRDIAQNAEGKGRIEYNYNADDPKKAAYNRLAANLPPHVSRHSSRRPACFRSRPVGVVDPTATGRLCAPRRRAAARRKRHDDSDRPIRIVLCPPHLRRRQEGSGACHQTEEAAARKSQGHLEKLPRPASRHESAFD